MGRTRWQTLVVVALGLTAATWIVFDAIEGQGGLPPDVPWLVAAVELVIAAVVLSLGWAVRQFLRGKRPNLDPIRAARTAVLAKASCYTGALLAGWYAGQTIVLLTDLQTVGNGGRALSAGAAAVGAIVLVVVGLVVEGFCRIPPPKDEEPEPAAHPSAG